MVIELSHLVENFLGEANRTQCFAHIINLVAKSLLKQFDVPKKKADEAIDEAEQTLAELAEGLDIEELMTRLDTVGGDDGCADDDDEGLVNEVARLSEEEQAALSESIWPVRLTLVKVMLNVLTSDLPAS
jgi:hypothetical protein